MEKTYQIEQSRTKRYKHRRQRTTKEMHPRGSIQSFVCSLSLFLSFLLYLLLSPSLSLFVFENIAQGQLPIYYIFIFVFVQLLLFIITFARVFICLTVIVVPCMCVSADFFHCSFDSDTILIEIKRIILSFQSGGFEFGRFVVIAVVFITLCYWVACSPQFQCSTQRERELNLHSFVSMRFSSYMSMLFVLFISQFVIYSGCCC